MGKIKTAQSVILTRQDEFKPSVSNYITLGSSVQHLVLVEGLDDLLVMHQLINYLGTIELLLVPETVHIHSIDGQPNLKKVLALLLDPIKDSKQIKTLSIFFDADEDSQAAFNGKTKAGTDGICTVLKALNLKQPTQPGPDGLVWEDTLEVWIGGFIVGNKTVLGAMESVLLETTHFKTDQSLLECGKNFIACLQQKHTSTFAVQDRDKLLAKAYLMTQKKFPSFGAAFEKQGSKEPLWTAKDPAFQDIITYLKKLVEKQ